MNELRAFAHLQQSQRHSTQQGHLPLMTVSSDALDFMEKSGHHCFDFPNSYLMSRKCMERALRLPENQIDKPRPQPAHPAAKWVWLSALIKNQERTP